MKKIGLLISGIGLIVIIFMGFRFDPNESMHMDSIEVMMGRQQTINWSPYLGISILAIGMIVYVIGMRNKQT